MEAIIVLIGIILSGILLAKNSVKRIGKVIWWRVIVSILLSFAVAVNAVRTISDPINFIAGFAGALCFSWFLLFSPRKTIKEETKPEIVYECSNCTTEISLNDTKCPNCGEQLEKL